MNTQNVKFYEGVIFLMKRFSKKYNVALYSHNKTAIISCLSIIHGTTCAGKKVKMKYALFTKWMLTHFYKPEVKRIEDLAKMEEISL